MNQKRQPRGVPTGGQFDNNEHDEAGGILPGGEYAFDRLGAGDSLVLPWGLQPDWAKAQGSSLFRDYDGQVMLITQYNSPLDGDWAAYEWAREHKPEYDDFLAREYGVEREHGTDRILIEVPVEEGDDYDPSDEGDEFTERERIEQAFHADVSQHFSREVESGAFREKVNAMIAADTIGDAKGDNGERADLDTAMTAAVDYYNGDLAEIEPNVARTLAREFTRGTALSYPHLERFVRTGHGSVASMLDEANKIDMRRSYATDHVGSVVTSEDRDRRYTALMGFLLQDRS